MRYIILTLLLLAAHFSLTPFAPAQVGQAWIGWPFAADSNPVLSFVGGLPQQTGSVLTPLLAGVAGLGFIAAACALFGVGIPTAWWPTLVVGFDDCLDSAVPSIPEPTGTVAHRDRSPSVVGCLGTTLDRYRAERYIA
jgi:hypothetical protein